MRVCAYCRVSTDKEEQENSFENQISYFERVITEKGHTLTRVYADKGLTGTLLDNRPEFEAMITDAGIDIVQYSGKRNKKHIAYEDSDREPLFDEIWIKNTSRFARNTSSFDIIQQFRNKGIGINFLDIGVNTKDPSADAMLKIMQVFDENASRDMSRKTRFGNEESAKRGRIRSSGKLFGYNYNRGENKLTIKENEADAVKLIFQMYAAGKGIRQIIRALSEQGYKTRSGKEFSKTTISRILDNEKYAGINNALKYDTGMVLAGGRHSPKVKQEYMQDVSERIEAIITPALFYQCRETRQSKVNCSTQKGIYHGMSKYAGMIVCGKCGAAYHRNTDKGRVFYNCSSKKTGMAHHCRMPNISEKKLDAHIDNFFTSGAYEAIQEESVNTAKNWLWISVDKALSDLDRDVIEEVKRIDAEITELTEHQDGLQLLFATQKTNGDKLKTKLDAVDNSILALQQEREELTRGNDAITKQIASYMELIYKLSSLSHNGNCKYGLEAISKIIINEHEGKPSPMIELKQNDEITNIVGSECWLSEEITPLEGDEILSTRNRAITHLKKEGYSEDELLKYHYMS